MAKLTLATLPFMQAAQYKPANRTAKDIDLIVLHSAEAPLKAGTARAVAHYFQTVERPASAHYCVDPGEIIHCVQHKDVAYGAPGANRKGLHIELAGYASFTAQDWLTPDSRKMLTLCAQLCAALCELYAIPATWLYPADLKSGKRGITSHANCTQAFGGTHTDPGAGFVFQTLLMQIKQGLLS